MSSTHVLIWVAAVAVIGAASVATSRIALAEKAPIFTGIVGGVAVGGYDPVTYFTERKPVRGQASIALEHGGATWRFSSEKSREAFKSDPDRYAPRYGGYCAYAVSQGYTAKGDPEAWSIVGDKLYLNYDKSVRTLWEKDIPGYIAKAEMNWPGVLGK